MMKMTLNEEIEYLQSGNWYDKVREALPADEYLKLGWAIGDILETLELVRNLAPEPQTDADRIRAMSDEQLAAYLAEISGGPILKTYKQLGLSLSDEKSKKYLNELTAEYLKRLQQPAEEDT